jgi:putative CocE/NonD family hydrolase
MDFSHEEIRDAAELMDWIVAQSWSNGNIGTTGVSYVGTTAELIIANQHPAHKAAIPKYEHNA